MAPARDTRALIGNGLGWMMGLMEDACRRHRRAARLLYVITDLERGGVPLHLHRLVRSLDRRRFNPLVISLAPRGPVSELIERERVPTVALNARHAGDLRVLWRLYRAVGRFRPDLIHALLLHANVAARLVGPPAGVPPSRIITEIQTVETERRWHLTADCLTHRLCRCEAGNSPAVVDHLHRHACISRSRLVLMPGGVDVEAIRRAVPVSRESLGVPEGVPLLIWVGRMDPAKGLGDLVAAMKEIAARTAAHLLLVGDGPERQSTETLVRRDGLAERVHFLGERSDVPSCLSAADLFVFPSYTEGLPNALLEATAAGLPVVTTDVPGCRDLIAHDCEGLLVPPGAPPAIAAAVTRLLGDPALGQRLGQAARTKVQLGYGLAACCARWAALYAACLRTRTEI